jgi:hypothetical protein
MTTGLARINLIITLENRASLTADFEQKVAHKLSGQSGLSGIQ